MFENENITHYPTTYEDYIPPMLHFTSPQKILFHQQSGIPQLVLPNEKIVLNLPRSIDSLRSCTYRSPFTLLELTLRASHKLFLSNNHLFEFLRAYLPETLYERLVLGPTAYCGNAGCGKPMFRECCFLVLRR